jgi:hypothetical protein
MTWNLFPLIYGFPCQFILFPKVIYTIYLTLYTTNYLTRQPLTHTEAIGFPSRTTVILCDCHVRWLPWMPVSPGGSSRALNPQSWLPLPNSLLPGVWFTIWASVLCFPGFEKLLLWSLVTH